MEAGQKPTAARKERMNNTRAAKHTDSKKTNAQKQQSKHDRKQSISIVETIAIRTTQILRR